MNDEQRRSEIARMVKLMGGAALRLAERSIRMMADDDATDKQQSLIEGMRE